MIIASLLAAMLTIPAAAQTQACASNEMTSAWEQVTFGLWLSDYTIPDSSPRTAVLRYAGCAVGADTMEYRSYSSEDRLYTVVARTNGGGANGATMLAMFRGDAGVDLGTWGHHKVFYKGVGIDKVAVPNGAGRTTVKNVFVIPVAVVAKP
jgi:hypothetical protein